MSKPLQSVKPLARPAGTSDHTPPAKKLRTSVDPVASSSTAGPQNQLDQASGYSGLNHKREEREPSNKWARTRPYRWQYKNEDSVAWSDFTDSEAIEKSYCKVDCEQCDVTMPITNSNTLQQQNDKEVGILFFDNVNKDQIMSMIFPESGKSLQVRRISAPSSVEATSSEVVTIWKWYWFDKNKNQWIQYGSENDKNSKPRVTVEDIELAFVSSVGHYRFNSSASGQHDKYHLDFSTMVEKNIDSRTETKIRRRPEFVESGIKGSEAASGNPEDEPQRFKRPDYWTNEGDDHLVQYVELNKTDADYIFLEKGFKATLPKYRVKSITRVQTLEVFEAFDRKRVWMKRKNNNEDPKKLLLFHGTSASTIKAICEQGFDCRISGSKTGTAYGKGTYFAVNANMAARYADSKSMFVCKVLVGDSCQGNKHFVRPPAKDPRKPNENFYDSCVDNILDPKMYVIFKPEQAYPEYIIKYK